MTLTVFSWFFLITVFLGLLILDLGIFHKRGISPSYKKSLAISVFYILISFLFALYVYHYFGSIKAQEFLTGYLIEKSLSLDNIFLIAIIFSYFKIPPAYQHRVLFWGILGAIILRGLLIGLGSVIVDEFSFVLYIFGIFLIVMGGKMLWHQDREQDISDSILLRIIKKFIHVNNNLDQEVFFLKGEKIYQDKWIKTRYAATPLFLSLLMIEFVDVIFAVDSIPAIFSITTDPFIVYSSNIFAILGLRSLYFVLQMMVTKFKYLQYSLSLLLIFIGSKIFAVHIFPISKVPTSITLGVTVILLGGGMLASLWTNKEKK
jgi:tellurite resistance protein TerC